MVKVQPVIIPIQERLLQRNTSVLKILIVRLGLAVVLLVRPEHVIAALEVLAVRLRPLVVRDQDLIVGHLILVVALNIVVLVRLVIPAIIIMVEFVDKIVIGVI